MRLRFAPPLCRPRPCALIFLCAIAGAGGALATPICRDADLPSPALWGELEPWQVVFDTTCFNEDREPRCRDGQTRRAFAAAVDGDQLYLVTGNDLMRFLIEPSGDVRFVRDFCRPLHDDATFSKTDKNYYYTDVAAEDSIVAMVVEGNHGLVVMDFTIPDYATVRYQDSQWSPTALALSEGIAYVASAGGTRIYDLRAVAAIDPPCLDTSGFHDPSHECGLLVGFLPAARVASLSASGRLLALTANAPNLTAELWDTSSLGQPRLLTTLPTVVAVALWRSEYGTFLATLGTERKLSIFEVGCLEAASCTTLPAPVAIVEGLNAPVDTIRVSQTDGNTVLWIGTSLSNGQGGSPAYAFRVNLPWRPRDISPPGYWQHYDQFPWIWPARALLVGDHLYRTAFGIFDVHRRLEPPQIFADGFESGDKSAWTPDWVVDPSLLSSGRPSGR